jgi:lipid II:glycine glycyltransferase (peptidoglycan interpeptide bridge formation enzyme)
MALVIKNCPRKDVHADIVTAFDRLGLRTTLTPGGADAVLALEGRTVENIRKGFNHGTKWRINKGQRAALRIRRLTEGQDLREAYKAWIATAARKGFSDVRPWEAIEPVLRRCVDTRLGSVLASFLEERLLAAAFVAQVGNTATWVYGGFVDGAEQYNPTHVLQFEAIRECLEKGLGAYNFGSLISYGQPTRNGVDEFKLGFGAEAREHLDTITWQRKPTLCWLVERLRHGRIGRHLEALLKRRLTGHRDRDNQATA